MSARTHLYPKVHVFLHQVDGNPGVWLTGWIHQPVVHHNCSTEVALVVNAHGDPQNIPQGAGPDMREIMDDV